VIAAELRGLLARKLRTVLTMIAIILGVSMISGTYVLTDTISSSFNSIFQQTTRHIDAVITGRAVVSSAFERNPPVPASLLPIVQRAPGVSAADGEIADQASLFEANKRLGTVGKVRRRFGSSGGAPSLLFGIGDQRFNQLTLVKGAWPHGRQLVLDQSTMQRDHLRIGQHIGIAAAAPLQTFTIVGETRFGDVGSIGGATLIQVDLHTAQRLTGKVGKFDQISVMGQPGISQKRVVRNIESRIPFALRPSVRVRTGEQQAASQASQIGTALNFLTIALLVFGGIAVFVGAFIIFNTFSITVAQRSREFALLRTLGSTRGQVLRTVVLEAFLIGLVSAVIGLLAGFGVAKGLNGLFVALGINLPNTGLVLEARTVVVALAVGILVSVAAGMVPAIRATRVPPMAAMREGVALPRSRFAHLTPYLAGLVIAAGILFALLGIFASISSAGERLILIGLGAGLLFIGVAMLSPQLIKPIAAVVGWPIERLTSITGRLARENTVRNPSRTAITAAALMVGLALVAFVTIFAAELKLSANDAINRDIAGTYIVDNNQTNQNTIVPAAVSDIAAVPGVSIVSAYRRDVASIRGVGTTTVDGIDPATAARVYRYRWKHGSDATVRSLGPHQAIVDDGFQSANHVHIGSTLHFLTAAGVRDTFRVAGVYKASGLISGVEIANSTFRRDWAQPDFDIVVVQAAAGQNVSRLEQRLSSVLSSRYPALSIMSQQQFKNQEDSSINSLLALIYALLALSIIVSLFGIINTLVLSIYERTREIGMLRAIGTTRRQIRWMVRWESVITAVIGAVLGLLLGIGLSVIITIGLQSQGIEFTLPIGQLLIWVVVAAVFGVVAAAFPARRAAKLDVLRAIAYE